MFTGAVGLEEMWITDIGYQVDEDSNISITLYFDAKDAERECHSIEIQPSLLNIGRNKINEIFNNSAFSYKQNEVSQITNSISINISILFDGTH